MRSYYENKYAVFWIDNSILFAELKPGITIDLTAARQLVAQRIQMQNGKAYPVFCDARGIVDSDKGGRDYLAQYGSVLAKAVGLFTEQKSLPFLMSSFYLEVSKPRVPTGLFYDKSAALEFLAAFV